MINSVDEFILYDEVQYTKNDWRNRNKIKTPNGVQWITIPVFQKSLEQSIHETKVSDVKWARKNWNSLVANYSKTGFGLDGGRQKGQLQAEVYNESQLGANAGKRFISL